MIGLVDAVVFAGPPNTRAKALAGRGDKVISLFVFLPGESALPRWIGCFFGFAVVFDFDDFSCSNGQGLLEVDPVDVALASELEGLLFVSDRLDLQWRLQVNLHSSCFGEHFESDLILAFDGF